MSRNGINLGLTFESLVFTNQYGTLVVKACRMMTSWLRSSKSKKGFTVLTEKHASVPYKYNRADGMTSSSFLIENYSAASTRLTMSTCATRLQMSDLCTHVVPSTHTYLLFEANIPTACRLAPFPGQRDWVVAPMSPLPCFRYQSARKAQWNMSVKVLLVVVLMT